MSEYTMIEFVEFMNSYLINTTLENEEKVAE
jgi:hypothetical protein